jgi:flagellar basal-body rod protein FlgC
MSLLTALEVGASGLKAQRTRIEILVSNLANAYTTGPAGTEPYRRKDVVFATTPPRSSFGGELNNAMEGVNGVEVASITVDTSDPILRYEPGNPHADKNGNVSYPNINPMDEMVNILDATRSYEANLQAVVTAKDMAMKTLDIVR